MIFLYTGHKILFLMKNNNDYYLIINTIKYNCQNIFKPINKDNI